MYSIRGAGCSWPAQAKQGEEYFSRMEQMSPGVKPSWPLISKKTKHSASAAGLGGELALGASRRQSVSGSREPSSGSFSGFRKKFLVTYTVFRRPAVRAAGIREKQEERSRSALRK
ncbi:hypothetical protein MHYP_G00119170 [Metynnis hypsauchen]